MLNGVLLSIIIYRAIGSACILGALILGGKPVYNELKEKLRRKNLVNRNASRTLTKRNP